MATFLLHDVPRTSRRSAPSEPASDHEPGRDARELIDRFGSLAHAIARRLAGPGTDEDDMHQVALIALWEAASRFDRSRGVPFGSYAARFVSGRLKQYRRDRTRLVRWPRSVHDGFFAVDRAEQDLTAELGRHPTAEELAARSGCDLQQVATVLRARSAPGHVSLDAGDGRPDAEPGAVDAALATAGDRVEVASLLRSLDERARRVVVLRFYGDLSQREIAQTMGLSQMHVCRLLRASLETLRRAAQDRAAQDRVAVAEGPVAEDRPMGRARPVLAQDGTSPDGARDDSGDPTSVAAATLCA